MIHYRLGTFFSFNLFAFFGICQFFPMHKLHFYLLKNLMLFPFRKNLSRNHTSFLFWNFGIHSINPLLHKKLVFCVFWQKLFLKPRCGGLPWETISVLDAAILFHYLHSVLLFYRTFRIHNHGPLDFNIKEMVNPLLSD